MTDLQNRVCHIAATAVFASFLAGCGGASTTDYVPKTEGARQALQTALDAWKGGAKYEPITSSKPSINVFDARWRDGQKLEKFEIVKELPPAAETGARQFAVKMQLAGESEQEEIYLVVGIDPLNVFREVDYRKASGI